MVAVTRILRILKGTLQHGLMVRPGPFSLQAYCDADWVGSPHDRRSTSGFCVFLGPNSVSWCAKKQPTMAHSSTKAAYRCFALLKSLGYALFYAIFISRCLLYLSFGVTTLVQFSLPSIQFSMREPNILKLTTTLFFKKWPTNNLMFGLSPRWIRSLISSTKVLHRTVFVISRANFTYNLARISLRGGDRVCTFGPTVTVSIDHLKGCYCIT